MTRKHEEKNFELIVDHSHKNNKGVHTFLFNLILNADRAMIQVLKCEAMRTPSGRTYLLGNKSFNILHSGNGKGKLF